MQKIIYTNDPQNEIWLLLGLFQSKQFVKDKLKIKYPTISEPELDIRTDSIIYCIRQAREFFVSAQQVSVLTSPLLLSYGMLNLGKALVYYRSPEGTDFKDLFKKHGLKFQRNDEAKSFADEYIEIRKNGTYPQIAKSYDQIAYENIQISLKNLLSQVPDLAEMYQFIYNEYPRVFPLYKGKGTKNICMNSGENCQKFIEKFNELKPIIFDLHKISREIFNSNEVTTISILENFRGTDTKTLKELDLIIPSVSGVEYFCAVPVIESKAIVLKELSIHYLLIFSYGMLSRYHALKWGRFIDPNFSIEAEIINKSIQVSRSRFLHLLVGYLFGEDFKFKKFIEKPEKNIALTDDELKERIVKVLRDLT